MAEDKRFQSEQSDMDEDDSMSEEQRRNASGKPRPPVAEKPKQFQAPGTEVRK